jgi:ribonuclease BN (tRNA processing enzyme)
MKLTVIGCSGSYAGMYGPASCYLVEHDGCGVVLDMGNGALGALMEHRDVYSIDAVLLSHLHLDHIADLGGLYVARKYRPGGAPGKLAIHGPASSADRLGRMYAPHDDEDDLTDSFEFVPYTPDSFKVGPFDVTVVPAAHPVDAFSLRIAAGGKVLTFSGDTGRSEALVDLARGSELLLAEASFLEGRPNPPDLHLTAREAVDHGVRAGVSRIVLTHFVPWNDINETVTEAQAARDEFGFDGDLQLAHSGLVVEF